MLPAHYNKKETPYFCRFTFGQFFTLLVVEIFSLFFIFYLGARYGRELLGIEVLAKAEKGEGSVPIVATDISKVSTTADPEIRALAKDILNSAPTADLKERVQEMLQEAPKQAPVVDNRPVTQKPVVEKETPPPSAEKTSPETPEAPPVIQATPTTMKGKYTVQVGSYTDPNEAHLMQNHWKEKGYPAYLVSADIPDRGRWYRVRLGGFDTREEATQFLEAFKQQEGIEGFIAPKE